VPIPASQPRNDFYTKTVPLLRWAMVLLALAMELGAGLALREARRSSPGGSEDWNALRNALMETRARMARLVAEISGLENEADVFAATFWRDFYRALLTNAARNAIAKLLIVVLAVMLVPCARAESDGHLDLVIAVDLTRSVSVTGPDGKSDFQKNLDGVSRVLAQVPAGAHITVIGITGRTFTQPHILLSASVSPDPGYFGERIAAARDALIRGWSVRSATLRPDSRSTDILGAFLLASQIFAQSPAGNRKLLLIFSDLRNTAFGLNLERPLSLLHAQSLLDARHISVADLQGITVDALGVDGAGESTTYWQRLQAFWAEYLRQSGARVGSFSVLRGLPAQ